MQSPRSLDTHTCSGPCVWLRESLNGGVVGATRHYLECPRVPGGQLHPLRHFRTIRTPSRPPYNCSHRHAAVVCVVGMVCYTTPLALFRSLDNLDAVTQMCFKWAPTALQRLALLFLEEFSIARTKSKPLVVHSNSTPLPLAKLPLSVPCRVSILRLKRVSTWV